MADFHKPQGRRTIRRADPVVVHNPMVPVDGRANRPIRMWDLGDAQPGTTAHKLQQAYHAALGAVDKVEARKADTLKSGKFTESGAKDEVTQFALSELTPVFRRGRNTIDAARREAKEVRDKIKLQPTDKTDIVGALRRRETREFLRAMPPKDRNRYVSARRENMDPELALAIVEMPAEFSGVLEMYRNDLIDRALEAQHGESMTQLKELEHAIGLAEIAVETGRDEVRLETGLSRHVFDERAATFEAKLHTPWLRKQEWLGKEEIAVVLVGKGINGGNASRRATPEELETGRYFMDIDEYRKANPDAA